MTTVTRPTGVTILAVLHVLQAILLSLGGLALLAMGFLLSRLLLRFPNLLRGLLPVIGAGLIVIALLDVVLAYGLWTGKGWAWIISLILAALGILFSLASLAFRGAGGVITLIINAVIVYYLTRPNVKAFFGEGPKATVQTQAQQVPPAAATATGSKYCSNCGAPATPAEQFCAHCGTKLPQ